MWIYNHEKCDYELVEWENPKKSLPPNVHQMNKDESTLLRKLMSETGMSEVDIRKIKKYRMMLSDAQKSGQTTEKSLQEKYIDGLMKQVTKELKLAKEHPKVIERFKELLNEKRNSGYYPWYMIGI